MSVFKKKKSAEDYFGGLTHQVARTGLSRVVNIKTNKSRSWKISTLTFQETSRKGTAGPMQKLSSVTEAIPNKN